MKLGLDELCEEDKEKECANEGGGESDLVAVGHEASSGVW